MKKKVQNSQFTDHVIVYHRYVYMHFRRSERECELASAMCRKLLRNVDDLSESIRSNEVRQIVSVEGVGSVTTEGSRKRRQ